MRAKRMYGGVLVVASWLLLSGFVGVAHAQQKYIVGYMDFDCSLDPCLPGTEVAHPWGGVEITTNPPANEVKLAVPSTASAGYLETFLLNNTVLWGCDQGTAASTYCYNSTAQYPNAPSYVEAEGAYEHQAGYYGNWDAKGVYRYWVGTSQLSSPIFSIQVTINFGYPDGTDDHGCNTDEYWDETTQSCIPYDCPILISLASQKYTLTSAEDGVWFDINADGIPDHIGWTQADEDLAFLAYDKNGNGLIDDGSELFGNHTVPGATTGFEALAKWSHVTSGMLTAENGGAYFAKLLLWTDRNHDGISQPDEIEPFSKYFDAIGLGFGRANRRDGQGNLFRWEGFVMAKSSKPLKNYEREDYPLHQKKIYDVIFASVKQ